jgi:hypothetical protein
MAMPTVEKTWQYNVNQGCGGLGSGNDPPDMLFHLKQSLIGFASSPWTVWGSSNGAGSFGNNDGIDRWITSANCLMGGASAAWIVLKQAGINASFALCFYCNSGVSGATTMQFVAFPTGVGTNGSASARPSAADELVLRGPGRWGPVVGGGACVLHALQSTDGECTRIVFCRTGIACTFMAYDKPKSPIASWAAPAIATLVGSDIAGLATVTYANLNDRVDVSVLGDTFSRIGSVPTRLYFASSCGAGSSTLGEFVTFPDDDTGEFPLSAISLASDTFGSRGTLKGQLYDLWWGSTAVPTGECYPDDGSRQFAQFGHLVLPWDGSVPLIA